MINTPDTYHASVPKTYCRGISLVELSISIAIIGLILATVTVGANLVNTAKLRNVITGITNLRTAIEEFEGEYYMLPGDMDNAFDYWAADCAASAGECNGNGDGFINFSEATSGTPDEDLRALQHLVLAGNLAGAYSGVPAGGNRYEIDENTYSPDSYNNAAYSFITSLYPSTEVGADTIYGTYGEAIRLGSIINPDAAQDGYPFGGFLTAKDARSVDVKLDDGSPNKGSLYAIRSQSFDGASVSGCVDQNWDSTANDINFTLNSDEKTCALVYWYRKR